MNSTAKWLASALCVLGMTYAQAELAVDTKFAGSTKNQDQMTMEERITPEQEKFKQTWEQRVLQDIAASNEGITPTNGLADLSRAHLLWNGVDYYAWSVHYQSAEQIRRNREEVRMKINRPAIPGGGVCALFLHDKKLNPVTSIKINLPENNHATFCNGTRALGGAGKGADGLLLTVSYYLTDGKLAQRAQDIGKDWREQTLLLRLQKDATGRVQLVQDDRCLGNPNAYKNIPIARKALAKCKDMNNGWIMIEDR
ncbi:hypothetical protein [Pseudogulbenkiania ferrooxidans]|uniref:Uncharacterized protein n=1 Tax=Pseudogulbenkiania ferrooxidans 2002 TaxID=279714 RepID=B9Z7T1_9NEIS|nr:hypothetical protein [Pseudogulbenkiania ferrooxidans]EEG07217.1 hypothetical protein FuraDRAFT_3417 [Pseudogulbenkiania ferrooxidans 2002]